MLALVVVPDVGELIQLQPRQLGINKFCLALIKIRKRYNNTRVTRTKTRWPMPPGVQRGHGTNGHAADQINKLKSKALAQRSGKGYTEKSVKGTQRGLVKGIQRSPVKGTQRSLVMGIQRSL